MSLGAIDFGIIIDGAIIIVEFVSAQITANASKLSNLPLSERKKETDRITLGSSSTMMNSAIFGQLIILIVFIPILSLSGVEGKMFRPMALTFSFALIGAMLLCLTYVPVASSLLIKPQAQKTNSITAHLMRILTKCYSPVITWALKNTKKTWQEQPDY
jgi:cobalt-zinc-cadmium resistance protein CzcA